MRAIFVFAICLLATEAISSDYVGRAMSVCAPLEGQSGHSECVADAGTAICDGLSSPYDRLECAADFEHYHAARVEALRAKRKAASENTQRLIEQMQRPAQ